MTRERETNLRDCPGCGMPREDWPDSSTGGYIKGDDVYCCRGCAEGPRCTCAAARVDDPAARATAAAGRPADDAMTKDEIREDPASGDFVQSLQDETKQITPEDYGKDILKKAPKPDYSRD